MVGSPHESGRKVLSAAPIGTPVGNVWNAANAEEVGSGRDVMVGLPKVVALLEPGVTWRVILANGTVTTVQVLCEIKFTKDMKEGEMIYGVYDGEPKDDQRLTGIRRENAGLIIPILISALSKEILNIRSNSPNSYCMWKKLRLRYLLLVA